MRWHPAGWALVGLALVVASCGGSGDNTDEPEITIVAPAIGALDGLVDGNDAVRNDLPGGILVGAHFHDVPIHGFFTFDVTGLPAGARILRATLEIRQFAVSDAPYPALGQIVIDHVDLQGALDPDDFDSVALAASFAVVSANPDPASITLDVTGRVGADQVAGRTESSYRLRFNGAVSANGTTDAAHFQDAEDHEGSGILPRIVIVYRP